MMRIILAPEMNHPMLFYCRCLAVSWPLRYGLQMTHPIASIMLLCVWTYGTAFAAIPVFGWGTYTYIDDVLSCTLNWKGKANVSCNFITLCHAIT